jgi:hypothetical protein
MPNRVKTRVRHTPNLGWDAAIHEARRQLTIAERRVEGLKQTVHNWTKLKKEGMPWPGEKSDQNEAR